MKLVRRNNWSPVYNPFFDDFFTKELYNSNSVNNSFTPAVNITENNDQFEVILAVPGYKKEDFNVKLENEVLEISANMENKENDTKFLRKEFTAASFKRTFKVEKNVVNEEKIEASYNNGILSILLPKREEVKPKPAKEIAIS